METCVCEIERLGLHDGPGIRTVVFLKGCPLRCVWCSNPETQLIKSQIYYNEKKCVGCKRCVEACEDNSVTFQDEWKFDSEKCTNVDKIVQSCPTGALKNTDKKMTTDEVFDYTYVITEDDLGVNVNKESILNAYYLENII